MVKVLFVIAFLIALCFMVQGFLSVVNDEVLFKRSENSSESDEVSNE